jgi:tyrosyl-tRNA synthetase
MLMGLKGPGGRMESAIDMADIKMSKSKPETCVFLHDGPKVIKRKLKKAYCPQGVVENNPIIDIARLILFQASNFQLEISRPEKFGGDVKFSSFEELEASFLQHEIHPLDLKNGVSEALGSYLKDARYKMEKNDDIMQDMSQLTEIPIDYE